MRYRLAILGCAAMLAGRPSVARAAELQPQTLKAYQDFVARLDEQFQQRVLQGDDAWGGRLRDRAADLRRGAIIVQAGGEQGLIGVPDGLIHDWYGAAFLPGVTLKEVLAVNQDYDAYATVHEPVIDSRLLERNGDVYRVFMRLRKGTAWVTAVLDTWSVVRYEYPSEYAAFGTTEINEIRQVEDAGTPRERSLSPGHDSGYLWRGKMYATFIERDGGVYTELRNVGLSRSIPWYFAVIVKPIVRHVGRSSVEDTLKETRRAVLAPRPGTAGVHRIAGLRPRRSSEMFTRRRGGSRLPHASAGRVAHLPREVRLAVANKEYSI